MINLFKSLQSILIMQKHEEYDRVNLANKQNTQKRKMKKWKEPDNFMQCAKNNAKKFYIKRRTA